MTWEDIGGLEDVKRELQELVQVGYLVHGESLPQSIVIELGSIGVLAHIHCRNCEHNSETYYPQVGGTKEPAFREPGSGWFGRIFSLVRFLSNSEDIPEPTFLFLLVSCGAPRQIPQVWHDTLQGSAILWTSWLWENLAGQSHC